MTVTDMTKEEWVRMREHLKPVIEKYTKEVGEDLANEIYAEIDKAHASIARKRVSNLAEKETAVSAPQFTAAGVAMK
jgi:hypothetical protein